MDSKIRAIIEESARTAKGLSDNEIHNIEKAAKVIMRSLRMGGKVLIFGNGGSAADSQHMAAELVGRFKKERRPFQAIALTTDNSIITAIANDYGYNAVFSRQIRALGSKKDAAVAISTSGNSKNVLEAVKSARSLGMTVIGLTGSGGGRLKSIADIPIVVCSDNTPRIQEAHIMIIHTICELVETAILKK